MSSLLDAMLTDAGMVDSYAGGVESFGLLSPPDGPAVLVYDIETSPMLGWSWHRFKPVIEDIELSTSLLCFAYQWLGRDDIKWVGLVQDPTYQPVRSVSLFDGVSRLNDRWVAERLAVLFDRADVTVAHNGDKFDTRKANSVFRRNELLPPSTYQTIDTLKETKRYFAEDSNRLDYLGRVNGNGGKVEHEKGMGLWFKCMAGDPDAWTRMKAYNVGDVHRLHDWYMEIRPWIGSPGKKAHPNMGHWSKGDRVCSKCGSGNLVPANTPHRGLVSEWVVWRCRDCGGQTRARVRKTQRGGQGVKTV